MKDIATPAIPATALCRLLQYADAHQAERCAGELAAAIAIEEWLTHVDGTSAAGIHLRGFQWKELFLPDGAQLCAWNRSGSLTPRSLATGSRQCRHMN